MIVPVSFHCPSCGERRDNPAAAPDPSIEGPQFLAVHLGSEPRLCARCRDHGMVTCGRCGTVYEDGYECPRGCFDAR